MTILSSFLLVGTNDGCSAPCRAALEALIRKACAGTAHVALLAIAEIGLFLRCHERPPKEDNSMDIELTPANKIQGSMRHLRSARQAVQSYFSESMELVDRRLEDSHVNRWRFASLSFFHDRIVGFHRVLAAEALSIIARSAKRPEVARMAYDTLCGDYLAASLQIAIDARTAEHVAIACCRGLALLAIHESKSAGYVGLREVVEFLATHSAKQDSPATFAARDGLKQIVFENAALFRDASCLEELVSQMERNEDSRRFFFDLLLYLAVDDPESLRLNESHLKRVKALCTPETQETWKHFAHYAGFASEVSCLSDILAPFKSGNRQVLIVHNIREALGDEWIRHGHFVQSLLDLNPELEITILTERPWLYNHQRVTPLSIEAPGVLDSIKGRNFDVVANHYYLTGAHSEPVQELVVQEYRHRSALYLETVATTNYYCPAYAFMSRHGQVTSLMDSSLPDNVYAPYLHLAAELGLSYTKPKLESVLCGRKCPSSQRWIEHNILLNWKIAGRKLMLYNPFGGTYEQKGYTRFEIEAAAAYVLQAISDGYVVILPPRKNIPWGNPSIAYSIRAQLPKWARELCMIAPTPEDDPSLVINLLALVDKTASVEGGLSHLACYTRRPVDIILRMDAKQPMWLPIERCADQRETSILDEPHWLRESRKLQAGRRLPVRA